MKDLLKKVLTDRNVRNATTASAFVLTVVTAGAAWPAA